MRPGVAASEDASALLSRVNAALGGSQITGSLGGEIGELAPRFVGGFLGAAQLGRGHHLHGLGDFANAVDRLHAQLDSLLIGGESLFPDQAFKHL